ncbi:MAG: hypothetical protein EBU01_08770 [Crocinitomicaceae bacterium]|nr:hypothetical protein [Crocinitomicaceae bacterium]
MPRQKKIKTEPPLELPPVIFFLKVGKDYHEEEVQVVPQPLAGETDYSNILNEIENVQTKYDETIMQELMSKFHMHTEYPPNTACFWCCHGFNWKPFVIPTHYDFYTNLYNAEGHFCSPECALSYVYSEPRLTDSQRWYRHSLLKSVYHELYRERDLRPAPDKRILRMFGGNVDIKQYREFLHSSTKPVQIAMPPIRLYLPSVNTQSSSRDVKSYVTLTNDAIDKASQQLRLKRSKPVHSNTHTFDKCLNIPEKAIQ